MLHTETKFQSKQIVTHDYPAVSRETKELGGLRGYKYEFAYEGDPTFLISVKLIKIWALSRGVEM